MMLQLVNLSNDAMDNKLIRNNADCLQAFLNHHQLDGLEMLLCGPWDRSLHKRDWVHGVHLRFWPSWLDFWRGDRTEVLRQFGSEAKIKKCYGGLNRKDWLDLYRDNIRAAQQAGASYLVFHVAHARNDELFNWRFSASNREVIMAAIEAVNELAADIPRETALLFENLWWPGLTLLDRELTALLLENVKHPNIGLMLDTGHLMNTNPRLRTEREGVDYILEKLFRLGTCRRYIRGIHLHRSLSGRYIMDSQAVARPDYTPAGVMKHVMKMDEHLPFSIPEVRHIVDFVQPDYLVHEFLQVSPEEWGRKIVQQQQALGFRNAGTALAGRLSPGVTG